MLFCTGIIRRLPAHFSFSLAEAVMGENEIDLIGFRLMFIKKN
jgi:hypothetical protein